jgi:mannose-6-phosphate isomerase-like protein (cupin superfamily)
MAAAYTLRKLTDVEDSAPKFGMDSVGEFRFAKNELAAADTGVSHNLLKPGKRMPFGHKHEAAEEVYIVIAGFGRVKLDEEIVDIQALDALRVAPQVTRAFEAGADGLEWLAVGPRRDGDGEIIQGWWGD